MLSKPTAISNHVGDRGWARLSCVGREGQGGGWAPGTHPPVDHEHQFAALSKRTTLQMNRAFSRAAHSLAC